jgi:hypothetical protein
MLFFQKWLQEWVRMYLYKVMIFAASLVYNIFDVWNAKIVVKRGV